jgi:hypothetical protein
MRKIHLVESTMSGGEEGGKYIWWNLLCLGGRKEENTSGGIYYVQ